MLKEILQGRFMNHPLHPLLVHIPVGLWVSSLIFDFVYFSGQNPLIASTSYYCIILGIIGAAVAAIAGLADYLAIPPKTTAKQLATTHFALNAVVIIFYILNAVARYRTESAIPTAVTGGVFLFSLISVVILAISGFLGGMLVYRYGIGHRPLEKHKEEIRRVA